MINVGEALPHTQSGRERASMIIHMRRYVCIYTYKPNSLPLHAPDWIAPQETNCLTSKDRKCQNFESIYFETF